MDRIRILIADDFKLVRAGLRNLLEAQPDLEVVAEAGDGREAVRLACELHPDVVLLDVSMPKLDGLQAAKEIKKVAPEAKILTLTRHTEAAYLRKLLRAGVSGYVLKQNAPADLVRAVRAVAGGDSYIDSALSDADRGKISSDESSSAGEAQDAGGSERLTDDERRVLRRVAAGLSNKEIAARTRLASETVGKLKAAALEKLGISRRKDIARYAASQGWI